MRTVSFAISNIIDSSAELQFGFSAGLFNLTQLARFIKPMVEAQTFKEVQESSLVMALSRLARNRTPSSKARIIREFKIENVSVRSGLSTLTLHRSADTHRATQAIYSKLNRKESYFTLSEGTSEITIIFERSELAAVLAALPVGERPKLRRDNIAALGVRFHEKYIAIPGLLHRILQQITMQGINIAELASTATELVIYIDEKDVRFGLDTLLRAFVEKAP